jgi:hypothetical protein
LESDRPIGSRLVVVDAAGAGFGWLAERLKTELLVVVVVGANTG